MLQIAFRRELGNAINWSIRRERERERQTTIVSTQMDIRIEREHGVLLARFYWKRARMFHAWNKSA